MNIGDEHRHVCMLYVCPSVQVSITNCRVFFSYFFASSSSCIRPATLRSRTACIKHPAACASLPLCPTKTTAYEATAETSPTWTGPSSPRSNLMYPYGYVNHSFNVTSFEFPSAERPDPLFSCPLFFFGRPSRRLPFFLIEMHKYKGAGSTTTPHLARRSVSPKVRAHPSARPPRRVDLLPVAAIHWRSSTSDAGSNTRATLPRVFVPPHLRQPHSGDYPSTHSHTSTSPAAILALELGGDTFNGRGRHIPPMSP